VAARLQARGMGVRKIAFNGGDRADWPQAGLRDDYTGDAAGFADYLSDYVAQHRITDIVFYSYWRPLHQAAIRLARARGIALHGFEEGLLRPHWITCDPRLPCEQAASLADTVGGKLANPAAAAADSLPVQPPMLLRNANLWMIFWCLRYYAGYFFGLGRFRRYRTHRPLRPGREIFLWAKQMACYPWRKWRANKNLAAALADPAPCFLLCLQLDGDSQIQQYCDYDGMIEVMADVLPSFARHAPQDARLVVKSHPLDNDTGRLEKACARIARAEGIENRVTFIGFGKLAGLMRKTRGLVTVNSTVGLSALLHECPVKTLGQAVYNIDGLADKQDLASFWTQPQPPRMQAYNALHDALVETSQHAGGFYVPSALPETIASCMPVLLSRRVPRAVEDAACLPERRVKKAAAR
jgi:capsular polysaccharide export protein